MAKYIVRKTCEYSMAVDAASEDAACEAAMIPGADWGECDETIEAVREAEEAPFAVGSVAELVQWARQAAGINTTLMQNGIEPTVGFTWDYTWIYDPFTSPDPQRSGEEVDPVEQYGEAYLASTFYREPGLALAEAQEQLTAFLVLKSSEEAQ